MSKEEFLRTYILNRALAHAGGLRGRDAFEEAYAAWYYLQKELKERPS